MLTLDHIRDIQIYQNRDGYRFSVDALLLYSFVNLTRIKRIADLGAGSGIIGILLARRYPSAAVALVELQKSL
ncbi:MAG: methyltransferase, partial [Nitrospirae bacterium]|nr:methyltransferase [Nitrospirota bacterium]